MQCFIRFAAGRSRVRRVVPLPQHSCLCAAQGAHCGRCRAARGCRSVRDAARRSAAQGPRGIQRRPAVLRVPWILSAVVQTLAASSCFRKSFAFSLQYTADPITIVKRGEGFLFIIDVCSITDVLLRSFLVNGIPAMPQKLRTLLRLQVHSTHFFSRSAVGCIKTAVCEEICFQEYHH